MSMPRGLSYNFALTEQLLIAILAFFARQYWPLLAFTGLWPIRPLLSSSAHPTLTQPWVSKL
jgi:hypothetical protein